MVGEISIVKSRIAYSCDPFGRSGRIVSGQVTRTSSVIGHVCISQRDEKGKKNGDSRTDQKVRAMRCEVAKKGDGGWV